MENSLKTSLSVTQDRIEKIVNQADVECLTMGEKTTVVKMVTNTGFVLIESSSCVDPVNYDEEIGRNVCMDRIKNKLWELEGYLLQNDIRVKLQSLLPIAEMCHEANRAYCAALGDFSQLPWDEAPQWQRESAISGVIHLQSHRDATPEDSHRSWLREKEATGWKYGPVKDVEKKEHPCFVQYNDLPTEQKAKVYIFAAICRTAFAIAGV
jgi:hypothetical protein